jgi:molecular chaperone DnaJ
MPTKRDYYEILGVGKSASKDELKDAYRTLALKFHPDRNKETGAEERFKEISEAYAVLSDDQKRAAYDQYGHAGFDQRYSQEDIFQNAHFEDIFRDMGASFGGSGSPFDEMFFSSIFGGGGRRRGPSRGADLRYDVSISLEDAAKGLEQEIRYKHNARCERCSGSGAEPGSKVVKCPKCHGQGQVQTTKRLGPFGSFTSVSTCQECAGNGEAPEKHCRDCRGSGSTIKDEKVSVEIPAGVDTGSRLRLSNLGERGAGGNGDLYVFVHVKDHQLFKREEENIHLQLPIGFAQAALGAEVEVPTLWGKTKLKIPAGTQSHTTAKTLHVLAHKSHISY